MKSLFYFALLGMMLVFTACKDQKDAGENAQMEAVTTVHDELMTKMVEISALEEQLSSEVPDSLMTTEQRETLLDLQAANVAMMDWMREFNEAFDMDEVLNRKPLTAAKKDTLEKYSRSVLELQDKMLSAIARGQATYDDLKKQ